MYHVHVSISDEQWTVDLTIIYLAIGNRLLISHPKWISSYWTRSVVDYWPSLSFLFYFCIAGTVRPFLLGKILNSILILKTQDLEDFIVVTSLRRSHTYISVAKGLLNFGEFLQ